MFLGTDGRHGRGDLVGQGGSFSTQPLSLGLCPGATAKLGFISNSSRRQEKSPTLAQTIGLSHETFLLAAQAAAFGSELIAVLDQLLLFVEFAQALGQLLQRKLRARHNAHLRNQLADPPGQGFELRALSGELALPLFQLLIEVAPLFAFARDHAYLAGTDLGRQAERREQPLPFLASDPKGLLCRFRMPGRRIGFSLGRLALGVERQQFFQPCQRLLRRLQPGDQRTAPLGQAWSNRSRSARASLACSLSKAICWWHVSSCELALCSMPNLIAAAAPAASTPTIPTGQPNAPLSEAGSTSPATNSNTRAHPNTNSAPRPASAQDGKI